MESYMYLNLLVQCCVESQYQLQKYVQLILVIIHSLDNIHYFYRKLYAMKW